MRSESRREGKGEYNTVIPDRIDHLSLSALRCILVFSQEGYLFPDEPILPDGNDSFLDTGSLVANSPNNNRTYGFHHRPA
jgi:hypothetical protein